MDIITSAMAKPKVIDLTQFESPVMAICYTLNDYLLYVYSQGGWIANGFTLDPSFWDAVKTDKPISFVVDATAFMGLKIYADAHSVVKNSDGDVLTVSFSFISANSSDYEKLDVVFYNSLGGGQDLVGVTIESVTA